uniref:Myb-like domain-containing protein n=1 Tax=Leersia perrieri TaxID=77586 RepID=A0A0D9WJV4_9ORYZ
MSGSRSSSPNSNSQWSTKENKMFEQALAYYGEDTPNRWDKVSSAMGGIKSAEEVRCHYEVLQYDVDMIEAGRVPFPNYNTQGFWSRG